MLPKATVATPRSFPPRMYMQDGELAVLVALFASVKPKTVIEFGVNTGMTAQVLLKHIPSIEHYQGIDVEPGYHTPLPGQQTEVPMCPGFLANDDDRFELITRKHGSHDLVLGDLRECDAVFIDGDHSYGGVLADSQLAFHRIHSGGIIVWHDYGNYTVEVTQALDDLAGIDNHDIRHVEGTWLAFERF
jgi:predicted O-methyltransferase YrrM